MSPEERELPTDLGESLPVNPEEDFKKVQPDPETYDAAIAFARYEKVPDSDKYNPGLFQARITYRLEDPNFPQFHGVLVQGFGKNLNMITNGGKDKSYQWVAWCKAMGFDPNNPPKTTELQGLPVKIRTSTRAGNDDRIFTTVPQIWKRTEE